MAETVVLKLTYAGETHRVTVPLLADDPKDPAQALGYELVQAKVRETFPHLVGQWTLVYRDDEGDVVTLSHALEFDEACHVLLGMNTNGDDSKLPSLHFYVLSRVSFREKVMAPVLQKIVELAQLARDATTNLRNSELLGKGRDTFVRVAGGAVTQASVAINHLRNSEVLERGRESLGHSAAHTRTLLLSARSGVSTRLRRAGSAVAAGIERRRSSSGSSYDFDPTDFTKSQAPVTTTVAAPVPSPPSEVAVTVDLRQSLTSENQQTEAISEEAADDEMPALVPAESVEQQYESDADTLCDDDDDREWDIVDNSGAAAVAEEAIAEASGEWAQELEVLQGILVNLDEEHCCDLLGQYNGDVEAVLVELTNL